MSRFTSSCDGGWNTRFHFPLPLVCLAWSPRPPMAERLQATVPGGDSLLSTSCVPAVKPQGLACGATARSAKAQLAATKPRSRSYLVSARRLFLGHPKRHSEEPNPCPATFQETVPFLDLTLPANAERDCRGLSVARHHRLSGNLREAIPASRGRGSLAPTVEPSPGRFCGLLGLRLAGSSAVHRFRNRFFT
jgi:hypothetical protein